MNGQEAIKYIETTERFRIRPGLEAVGNLLNRMNNPQENLKIIHVAGTNGKGSTASFIASILEEAGLKVGLFTSPSLEVFNERIKINRVDISDNQLGDLVTDIKKYIDEIEEAGEESPTEFEIVTAVAFKYFSDEKVDIAVIEVGMGGRLDSTNIIKKPLVTVITPIDLDHVAYLGDTIDQVAFEKAGTIKQNSQVVIHPQDKLAEDVIKLKAKDMDCKLTIVDFNKLKITETSIEGSEFVCDGIKYRIGMLGDYQPQNAAVALNVINILKSEYNFEISNEEIKEGLLKSRWPGRLEVLNKNPYIIIDGAHNTHGIKGLKSTLKKIGKNKNLIGIVGIFEDKDVDSMLNEILNEFNVLIATEPDNLRGMKAEILEDKINELGFGCFTEKDNLMSVKKAIEIADSNTVIIVFGCLFMAGQMRTKIKKYLNV